MNPYYLICHAVFGLFSWFLYALVTVYIYHHRKEFNSAFTKLWNTFAIVNLLQCVSMKVYYLIPLHITKDSQFASYLQYLNANLPPVSLAAIYFFAYYFIYCQRICVLLIIGISFRLIVFPFSSSPLWERHYFLAIALIFLTPLPFTYNILSYEPTFNYLPNLDGHILFPGVKKYPSAGRTVLQSNLFEMSTAVCSGVLKMLSICCLSSNTVKKRDDRNLYVVTTIMFITSILKFVCAVLIVLDVNEYVKIAVVYFYPITADLMAVSCPYTLIYINKRMRKGIWSKLTGRQLPVDV